MARSRENQAWYDAIRNCYNPKRAQFSQYGAIGIKVCESWRQSFEQFMVDMGPAPADRPWLGRRDVRGDYEPTNCEWTNRAEQMNRRAFCRKVTLQGQEMTAAQASRLPGQPTRNGVLLRAANGMLSAKPVASRLLPKSKWIEFAGEKLPIYEWARRQGVALETLRMRLKRGWSIDQALNSELRQGRIPSPIPAPNSVQAAKAAPRQKLLHKEANAKEAERQAELRKLAVEDPPSHDCSRRREILSARRELGVAA